MKKLNNLKKLMMNKEIVRTLNENSMRLAAGGVACPETVWEPTCGAVAK